MLTREQRIGAFFVVGIVLLFVAIELTLGLGLLRRRYPLYATFRDVQGLDSGADVRLAGIKAGRVDGMQIEQDHDRGTGTLGLLLNDSSLYDRASVALGDVRQAVQDIGQVTHDLSEGRGTLGKLIREDGVLYAQVREMVDHLNESARNAEEITASLRDGQGTIGKALTDETLYSTGVDALRSMNRP